MSCVLGADMALNAQASLMLTGAGNQRVLCADAVDTKDARRRIVGVIDDTRAVGDVRGQSPKR